MAKNQRGKNSTNGLNISNMKKFKLILLLGFSAFAQENKELKLSFSGYLETYYSFDFNTPNSNQKLPFM
jgi:hypothetical protein